MNRARLRKLERLVREFSPRRQDTPFAPLWFSHWLAGFCAAADADMARPPQWHHYNSPWLHHRQELKIWLWRTLEDFKAMRGRLPLREEIRSWITSARLAAAPWHGRTTWPPEGGRST